MRSPRRDDRPSMPVAQEAPPPITKLITLAEGMTESAQSRLNDALRAVTAQSRRQLEAIKLSQLLEPPPTLDRD